MESEPEMASGSQHLGSAQRREPSSGVQRQAQREWPKCLLLPLCPACCPHPLLEEQPQVRVWSLSQREALLQCA